MSTPQLGGGSPPAVESGEYSGVDPRDRDKMLTNRVKPRCRVRHVSLQTVPISQEPSKEGLRAQYLLPVVINALFIDIF